MQRGLLRVDRSFTARYDFAIAVPAALATRSFTAVNLRDAYATFVSGVGTDTLTFSYTTAFGGTLLIFAVMTIYGLRTGRDLAGLGQLCLMGLFGLIAAGLFNIFVLQSEGLRLIMSIITIPIFIGLTAWETREIKREAQKAAGYCDPQAANRIALIGAAGMFLSILNMFLALLDLLSLDFSAFGGK